jgi:hypothetical protein
MAYYAVSASDHPAKYLGLSGLGIAMLFVHAVLNLETSIMVLRKQKPATIVMLLASYIMDTVFCICGIGLIIGGPVLLFKSLTDRPLPYILNLALHCLIAKDITGVWAAVSKILSNIVLSLRGNIVRENKQRKC